MKKKTKPNKKHLLLLDKAHTTFSRGLMVLVVALVVATGYLVVVYSHAATCTVNSIMVNSCRPWIGAAVGGDPKAPASDDVSQFNYLENILGRKLDLFHDYHPPGSIPMNSSETYFANRANTMDYINYKPASNWAAASGGNATVNQSIKNAADSVAKNGHKVFITIWHEPENDVSAFDNSTQAGACNSNPYFKALKGGAGTPDQYKAMWTNVQKIFRAENATNVVWVMNYMNYRPWECLVPYMWPENLTATNPTHVDWVTYEAYAEGSTTFKSKIGDMYNLLTSGANSTHAYTSHPWGIGEVGDCADSSATAASKYKELRSDIDNNYFPRLRMYMFFDSANGPGGTSGCLVDKGSDELSAVKAMVNDPVFVSGNTSPTPTPTPTPSTSSSPSVSASVTLVPSSDTYVDSAQPDANFGNTDPLRTSASNNRALLRLKTSGVVPSGYHITGATLRLYVTNENATSGGLQVHPEDGNFSAGTVTWNTQPAWSDTILATSGTPKAGSYINITLPKSAIDLAGDTTLGVIYTVTDAGTTFSSRENSSTPPKLTVYYAAN